MTQQQMTREDYEREERRLQFNEWWRKHGAAPVSRLPAQQQQAMHKLIKAAYMKGATMEAKKHEPVRCGGKD